MTPSHHIDALVRIKPDDIPQDVWDKASAALMQANIKAHMLAEPTDPLECISRAILATKAEERQRTQPIIDWAARQVRKPYSVVMALDAEAAIRKRGEL